MATVSDIVAALAGTGLPVAEGRWEPDSAESGPHIVIRHEGTRSMKANGMAYAIADAWSVSLYSERWEPSLEDSVQGALNAAGIPCDAAGGYDDEHGIHWAEWDFETAR